MADTVPTAKIVKISAAIFDIGNVLLPFDYLRAANRLIAENLPSSPPNRERVVAAKQELELGRIDRTEFLRRVRPEFNHTRSDEDFLVAWRDIFEPNPPLNSLVASLAHTLPLYLLSNISCIHREYIHATYPVFQYFRQGVYSYEVGMLKPDPRIFRLTAGRFGLNPSTTLYLDDMPENAEAARREGFVVIQYDYHDHFSAEQTIRALLG